MLVFTPDGFQEVILYILAYTRFSRKEILYRSVLLFFNCVKMNPGTR